MWEGREMSVLKSHNKRKSKEMQLRGTGNFIIFSMKCPEENLILKITSTLINEKRIYVKMCYFKN